MYPMRSGSEPGDTHRRPRCVLYVYLPRVARVELWIIPAIQGAGGAGLFSVSTIVLSDIVPLQERGTYNGILQV